MAYCSTPSPGITLINRTINGSFLLLRSTINSISQTHQKTASQTTRRFHKMNTSCYFQENSSSLTPPSLNDIRTSKRWRPLCLYHTQGKCTKMDDSIHLERFDHDCTRDLRIDASGSLRKRPQDFDYFLVLDLEGKIEILEFPVLLIDAKTLGVVDLFHRFVRPSAMSEQRVNEYIANKYGKFGVDSCAQFASYDQRMSVALEQQRQGGGILILRVWHDTAETFSEVVKQFETWLCQHHLWEKKHGDILNQAAFVTCGNWDVKTKIPQQCKISRIKLPPYFMEWINIKDVYKNFYNPKIEAKGMRTMMQQLKIPMLGSHHIGIDDTRNIARVLLHMIVDGAVIPITARRDPVSLENISFLYKNRIR